MEGSWYNRPGLAIGVPSFFFGLAHVPLLQIVLPMWVSIIIAAGVGGVGAFWGWLRNRTGTLIPGMISHALGADLSIALLGYFLII